MMGNEVAQPIHQVTLSPFYMENTEVTKAEWDSVAAWVNTHGYDIRINSALGKAPNHPAHTLMWYEATKWCNARSEMEGLTPVYYTNSSFSQIYRTGNIDLNNNYTNWSANGYRLPTEAEWEYAARGGTYYNIFPWNDSNTISQSRANYFARDDSPYDEGPYGYNPTYAVNGMPYTSPVGSFAPNAYGLYDMAGNVAELVWDYYAVYYSMYPDVNPHGISYGNSRGLRGGNWGGQYTYGAYLEQVFYRFSISTDGYEPYAGFRIVRNANTNSLRCYNNLQCPGFWTSGDYCNGKDVWNTWRNGTCNNPGTTNSYCSYTYFGKVKEICSASCYHNYCLSTLKPKADIAVFKPSNASWYISYSGGGWVTPQPYGLGTDKPVPADYDGDGKADFAVFRLSDVKWYIKGSSGVNIVKAFGLSSDIPVPADYDGDGKADIAVYRPSDSSWYITNATASKKLTVFGESGDIPVPADYDGDGKADVAVFRPRGATWYIIYSSTGIKTTKVFGISSDKPVPADYDGDGKAELAVYRANIPQFKWIILYPSGTVGMTLLGTTGDIPVPADYDGQ